MACFWLLTVFAELTVGEAQFARALLRVPAAVTREQLIVARRHWFLRAAFHNLRLELKKMLSPPLQRLIEERKNSPKCGPVCRRRRIGCR